jgi:putative peptidoglycan lipid II flippase
VLATAVATIVGFFLAPVITAAVAPGFDPFTRQVTIRLVQVLFPMFGIVILSAWCLGVLNTHGRFFLPYASGSLWNIAQIATLIGLGGILVGVPLVMALAVGAIVGSILQLVVQLPSALKLVGGLEWTLGRAMPDVRRVLAAWGPVVIGAGVVQISGLIDTFLASLLGSGAVAELTYAQYINLVPISLFGVSVAAVALPALSRDAVRPESGRVTDQITTGTRRILYFVVPSAYAFAALAVPIVGTILQTGRFGATDTEVTAGVLAAYAVGLPAMALVKLLASAFYALGDTRTPVKIAATAVTVSAVTAVTAMQVLGPAGIALGAAVGAYVNVGLLLRGLARRLPRREAAAAPARANLAVLTGALLATVAGVLTARVLQGAAPPIVGLGAAAGFGVAYLIITALLRHPEAVHLARQLRAGAAR